jgi:hypothetical protein
MKTSLFSSGRRQIARLVTLAVLAAVALAAQDKPDFSGRWILAGPEEPDPTSPRAMSVRQSLVRANVYGDPMKPYFKEMVIDREFESARDSETYLIGVVGGSVPGLNVHGVVAGPRRDWQVTWDGNTLVFESGSYTGESPGTGVWSERRETWSLDADGRLRVTISTRGSSDPSRTVTLMYRRS